MALSVYQNLYSITSQRFLNANQSALGKSIERLSSGLRINHAADDASGMAISEKMRGQISGLKRASMNAQDGISYLQTAEGAMEQTSSILQRMRELAVQASNGIYTTSDRAEIQKEVDQLKQEIDRISTSTEFNTRKLINGDGTGIWSADTDLLSAIIRGPVREGNYEITMSVDPGTNQIFKTDIMTLNKDAQGAEMVNLSAAVTNVGSISEPKSMIPSGNGVYSATISNSAGVSAASGSMTSIFQNSGSNWTNGTVTVNDADVSSYIEIEATNTSSSLATVEYRYRLIDPTTGKAGAWVTATGTATGLDFVDAASGIDIEIAMTMGVGGKVQQGDKMLVQVSAAVAAGDIASGGGTIKLTGPDGKVGPTLIFTGQGSLTSMDNADSVLDTTSVDVFHVTMDDKTGNINIGSVTMDFKETADGVVTAGGFEFAVRGGSEAATTSTKLRDIGVFTDGDGNNIFENKQELTIYGNGTSTVVHLEGNDTISTLVEKLNKAIQSLGMGSDDPNVNKNLVQYVTVPGDAGWDTIKGTMLIQTGMPGEQGELSFVGNQALIDAFSLAEVQSATNNESTVTVRDAHTGELIGTEVTGDDRVYTIIDGVEIVIDSRAGIVSRWDADTNGIVFEENPDLADKKMHLHLVDNRTSLQIGANKGQDLDVSIPQLDLRGLGIENVTMVSQDLARNAIGKIDAALTRVVSARATIGAQVSRLEYTVQNLATARENLVAAESRIRDLDVAEESANFASKQVLVQSGIAMLAQANQLPQMALQLLQG